nr:translation initiation factor IF-2-like [Aegilops tauschii subsp. strangulata]
MVLDQSTASYSTWKRYFSFVFREYLLHGHVDGTVDSSLMIHDEEWMILDASIIRWFYLTISNDLFHTVVDDDVDAYAVWTKLNDLFTDNKLQRKVLLHGEFYGCQQLDSSIDDFCMRLKKHADEIRDLAETVGDELLISTLTAGLNEAFENAASNLTLVPEPTFAKVVAYLKLEERRMKMAWTRATHTTLVAGTRGGSPPPPRPVPALPPVPAFPQAPAPPFPPPPWAASGGHRRGRKQQQGADSQGGAARPQQQQYQPAPWYAGQNPWTRAMHAYSMPVSRAPAPGILGTRPPSHQAFYAALQPYAAPYGPLSYGQPPLPGGLPLMPPTAPPEQPALPPAPWDPALLAALHSAPSPSTYTGGGDWYMDTGATAHMVAHPGCSYPDGTPPM